MSNIHGNAIRLSLRTYLVAGFAILSMLGHYGLCAQEALLSVEERYYNLLSLQGYAERPYLNYRTLSDSEWDVTDGSGTIWAANRLDRSVSLSDRVNYRIYDPDLFVSFNSAAPYGQNDGLLWQGKGLNTSLTAGARLEAYGFELTLKPQLVFSQNLSFDLIPPAYSGDGYEDKADTYGYYGVPSIDAPQRFGDEAFIDYSWGDSEIRYTWKALTIGFGTQSIWLGPSRINSILHSNNGVPYPKADIGVRRTNLSFNGWDLGDFEARIWAGRLTESDYFDTDSSNDHNLITGLSLGYSPPFVSGLTLFGNRVFLSKWESESAMSIANLFYNTSSDGADDEWDQRASFGFSYLIDKVGFELYGEAGINDFVVGDLGYLRYPFHSIVYMAGFTKTVNMKRDGWRGEFLFEFSYMELSQDFQFQWPSTYYAHHEIKQGYTSGGQWIGAGIGTGGNSQYLGFSLYYPEGKSTIYLYRVNPDNDYLYAKTVRTGASEEQSPSGTDYDFFRFKSSFAVGLESTYFVSESFRLSGSLVYNLIINPEYDFNGDSPTDSELMHNVHASISISYSL